MVEICPQAGQLHFACDADAGGIILAELNYVFALLWGKRDVQDPETEQSIDDEFLSLLHLHLPQKEDRYHDDGDVRQYVDDPMR